MPEIKPTTRAYSFRLQGTNNSWRGPLWNTHFTVNRGAQVFGDLLLTLRGGLPASLAEDGIILPVTDEVVEKQLKRRKLEPDYKETLRAELIEHRRRNLKVLLALSWLSVEAPRTVVLESPFVTDCDVILGNRPEEIEAKFAEVLKRVGVPTAEHDSWAECLKPLKACIRDDAVWVDRTAAFLRLQKHCGPSLDTAWAARTLLGLLKGKADYFATPDDDAPPAEAKEFGKEACHWISENWNKGPKSDFTGIAAHLHTLIETPSQSIVGRSSEQALISLACRLGIEPHVGASAQMLFKSIHETIGFRSNSKAAKAIERIRDASEVDQPLWDYVSRKLEEDRSAKATKGEARSVKPAWMQEVKAFCKSQIGLDGLSNAHTFEFAVMLSHALRRVSTAHTWIKRAEAARSKFKENADKIGLVPHLVVQWLDKFCEERSESSGADGAYHIRRRAIEAWEQVVQGWSHCDDTKAARITSARELQSDEEKFGDIQLFEALADDDATCVWHDAAGKPSAEPLKNYVAAKTAEHDELRFKVPAYRHPDPLRNPVFVDFGKSQWDIEYSTLETAHRLEKLQEKRAMAKNDAARAKIDEQLAQPFDLHGVTLKLWNGTAIEPVPLRWQGTRLHNDLDLKHFGQTGGTVSRADRLGRAVGKQPSGPANAAQVFAQKEWNGRLQVARRELDRLADKIYGKRQPASYERLKEMTESNRTACERLGWFLSFSAKLQPAGPWLDYVEEHGLADGTYGWQYKQGRSGAYLVHESSKDRKGRARLILSRLPGLRILSLDLGHRYAAACTVWLTCTSKEVADACRAANRAVPKPDDLYLFLKSPTDKIQNSGRRRGQPVEQTTVYRRIAADKLPDGSPHPAPWAKLERQFLIKLQGEDRPTRRPSDDERAFAAELRRWIDEPGDDDQPSARQVDEFLSDLVESARRGLRCHGDAARIAFAMTADYKPVSGGRRYRFRLPPGERDGFNDTPEQRRAAQIELLAENLARWHHAAHTGTNDTWAREQWQAWIAEPFGFALDASVANAGSRSERKIREQELHERLLPIAEKLLPLDAERTALHTLWADRWKRHDEQWKGNRGYLRRLRLLILPRRVQAKTNLAQIRNVGGLGLTRQAAIRGLYQLMKAYRGRPEPDDLTKNVSKLGDESLQNFGQRMLDALDRIRENRVKQTASRIVEAALGIGSENSEHWENGRRRPKVPVHPVCHVVVVENLEHYKPEQTRMRRENRGLRDWAARNVRKYIVEACELHGLYFAEVSPAYTSRQDSRTGAPGVRCQDVPVADFVHRPWWRNQVTKARDEVGPDRTKGTARDRYLVELDDLCLAKHWISLSDMEQKKLPPLRISVGGGELFVSADGQSSLVRGLQADLNAAANIGLRALLDPDWIGAWWYVPVDGRSRSPVKDKVQGSAALSLDKPLGTPPAAVDDEAKSDRKTRAGKPSRDGKAKDVVNLWTDLSQPPAKRRWLNYTQYKNEVECRVIDHLRRQAGLTTDSPVIPSEEDTPF